MREWSLTVSYSLSVSLRRLEQDLVGDRDLADVVDDRGLVQEPAPVGLPAQRPGNRPGEIGDPLGMATGRRILGVDGAREPEPGAQRGRRLLGGPPPGALGRAAPLLW